jgi:hypothetical protein
LWSLYAIITLSRELPRLEYRTAIYAGLAIGLTLAIRINGVVLFGYLAIVSSLVLWSSRSASHDHLNATRLLQRFLTLGAVAYATMFVFWPWAQAHPLSGPIDALTVFSAFSEQHHTVFGGIYVDSLDLPFEYVPTWLALTLPESIGIAFLIASSLYRKVTKLDIPNSDVIALLSLASLLPVGYAILNRTPLYDAIRHLLFVIPPMAVLAALGVASLRETIMTPAVRQILYAIPALALGLAAYEMVRIHPNQASYFNHVFAGTIYQAWMKYDSDYWNNSYKQGLKWIVNNYPDEEGGKVRIAGMLHALVKNQLDSDSHEAVQVWEQPDLYIATVRYGDHRAIPGDHLHAIRAGSADLLYILRPDTSYAGRPIFQSNPYIDRSRLKYCREVRSIQRRMVRGPWQATSTQSMRKSLPDWG